MLLLFIRSISSFTFKASNGYLSLQYNQFTFRGIPDDKFSIIPSDEKISIRYESEPPVFLCARNEGVYPCKGPFYWERKDLSIGFILKHGDMCLLADLKLGDCKKAVMFKNDKEDEPINKSNLMDVEHSLERYAKSFYGEDVKLKKGHESMLLEDAFHLSSDRSDENEGHDCRCNRPKRIGYLRKHDNAILPVYSNDDLFWDSRKKYEDLERYD